MQDLREKIQQKFNSKEYREAAVYLLLKEIFEAIKNHGDKTKLTPALTKRLVTVAFELAKREKTKTPLQQEVLLVTIPFDEYGNVELQNTQRVVLNHKDPMRIIGDTVKNAIEYSRMIYAGRYNTNLHNS
jgi:hypothetical protein